MSLADRLRTDQRQTRRSGRRDDGFTLTELLLVITVTGVITAVIGSSLVLLLRTTPDTQEKISESVDISFIQSWVSTDLSSAVKSSTSRDEDVVRAEFSSDPAPNLVWPSGLPGIHGLALALPSVSGTGHDFVAYRYVQGASGTYELRRYEVTSSGTSGVTISDEIKQPADPDTFDPVDGDISFAFTAAPPSRTSGPSVAAVIEVRFASDQVFSTAGAGLIDARTLDPYIVEAPPLQPLPSGPCGKHVALVLDTSYSVPFYNGGRSLQNAANTVIFGDPTDPEVPGLRNTPTSLTILGFDALAYQLWPDLNGTPGMYENLLLATDEEVAQARGNIDALPDVDNRGYSPGDTPPTQSSSIGSYVDPVGTGSGSPTGNNAIGWAQTRTLEGGSSVGQTTRAQGTNWEDALHAPFFQQVPAPGESYTRRTEIPDTVIFITDGNPNRQRFDFLSGIGGVEQVDDQVRTNADGTTYTVSGAVVAAENAARRAKDLNGNQRIIGVLVGETDDQALEDNLKRVVGPVEFSSAADNAAVADIFTTSFGDLAATLTDIVVADCGGTISITKEWADGSRADGTWNYLINGRSAQLDLDDGQAWVTVDLDFSDGDPDKTVNIEEIAPNGERFLDARCTVDTDPLENDSGETIAGVTLTLLPNATVSCVFRSERPSGGQP